MIVNMSDVPKELWLFVNLPGLYVIHYTRYGIFWQSWAGALKELADITPQKAEKK